MEHAARRMRTSVMRAAFREGMDAFIELLKTLETMNVMAGAFLCHLAKIKFSRAFE